MNDDETLAAVLRRFLTSEEYVNIYDYPILKPINARLVLDGRIDISEEEADVIERIAKTHE